MNAMQKRAFYLVMSCRAMDEAKRALYVMVD